MTGEQVLAVLKSRGVLLKPQGDKLHYRAPRGVLTQELRQALAEHKAEVLTLLKDCLDYYGATACVCTMPIGPTGAVRCKVCELPLICPPCGRCRGCKLRLRFPPGGAGRLP